VEENLSGRSITRQDRDWRGVSRIGVEAWMGLGAHRAARLDLQIERRLEGVVEIAKGAERRPLAAVPLQRWSEVADEKVLL
jgi:hypothetical protein